MSFQKFYGLALAEGAYVENMRVENIDDTDGVPDNIITTGRIWFNSKLQKLQYTRLNSLSQLSVETLNVSGWRSLDGDLIIGRAGTTYAPVWADMGNGFYAWRYDDAKTTWLQTFFNSPHDMDYTKKVYPFFQWCPTTTAIGNVRWRIEVLICKGFKQGAILNSAVNKQTFYVTSPTGGKAYEHLTMTLPDVNGLILSEPDSLILITIARIGADALDTYAGSVYGFKLNLHYWSDTTNTLGRMPSFAVLNTPINV